MTAAPPPVRYTLTQDHMVTALSLTTEDAQATQRRRYALYGVAAVVLAGALALLGGDEVAFFGLFGAAFLALALFQPALYRRRLEALTEGRADLGRTVTARVTDTEFQVEVEGVSRTAFRLGTIHRVEARDGGVLVETLPHDALWIPASAFATEAGREAFVRALLAGAPLPAPSL